MLQHEADRHRDPAVHRWRRRSPEAVYLQRLLAWTAVVTAAFVGIELIVDSHVVAGVLLVAVSAAGTVRLRSHGQVRALRRRPSSRSRHPAAQPSVRDSTDEDHAP